MTEHPITQLLDEAGDGAAEPQPTVGPYRLIRLLGQGGMGQVYEAWQEAPVRRRVALKLIRPGLGSRAVVARFHAERHALEVMDHPSIARVLDAGTTDHGLPYVVMELADGEPITTYCDRLGLDLEARIALLLPVCDAVQHAHRKGVIHRDLKPSNLLVVEQDGAPVPKIIDFGIAKDTATGDTEAAGVTRLGELVGTPEYMSPEQASLGAIDVDTRSDVYSLGLVLFELLVGELPLTGDELRRLAFGELCRRIREAETPRPSALLETRVGEDTRGVASATLDGTTRAAVLRRVRGDLDSVVLKALAKDREQRYDSAKALADDLRRFLCHEPVRATPPTVRIRVRKFARRHRLAVATAATVAAALIAGSGLAAVGLVRARAAEAEARASLATAERTAAFLVDLFRASDPRQQPGLALSAGELLARGVERSAELDGEPEVQARMLGTLGDVYWVLGAYDEAQPLLERAVALREHGPAADLGQLATALDRLGSVHRNRGDLEQAQAIHRRAVALAEKLEPVNEAMLAPILNNLGIALRLAERYDEAAAVYERSLELAEAREKPPGENVASVLNNLSRVYHALGRYEAAQAAATEALGIFERILPHNHPNLGVLHANLGVSAKNLGQLDVAVGHMERALEIDREVLPGGHPGIADDLQGLGNALFWQGRYASAASAFAEGAEIYAAALGPENLSTLRPRGGLAAVALATGDVAAAEARLEPVLAALRRSDHPAAASTLLAALRPQVTTRRLRGDLAGARAAVAELLALATRLGRPEDQALAHLDEALIALAAGDGDLAAERFSHGESLAGCRRDEVCGLDRASAWSFRAAYWARRGDLERAFGALGLALDHPQRSRWLVESPDLAVLRADPRWPRLVDEAERRLGIGPR